MGITAEVFTVPRFMGATIQASSKEDGIAKGREYGLLLLANDESRERVEIKVVRGCDVCGGTCRVLRKRTKMTYDDCKACNGTGAAETMAAETLTRANLPAV